MTTVQTGEDILVLRVADEDTRHSLELFGFMALLGRIERVLPRRLPRGALQDDVFAQLEDAVVLRYVVVRVRYESPLEVALAVGGAGGAATLVLRFITTLRTWKSSRAKELAEVRTQEAYATLYTEISEMLIEAFRKDGIGNPDQLAAVLLLGQGAGPLGPGLLQNAESMKKAVDMVSDMPAMDVSLNDL